jgi:hypothetical protein
MSAIELNDSLLAPVFDSSMEHFTPIIEGVINDLPKIIRSPTYMQTYKKRYEDTVRALDFQYKEKADIKVENITEDELEEIQEKIADRVASGESFEDAVVAIVGEEKEFLIETTSDGDCVAFETVVGNKNLEEIANNTRGLEEGTIIETNLNTKNGLTAKLTKIVENGKVVSYIECLVCSQKFDVCLEACPNCKTARALQYEAWESGKNKEEILRLRNKYNSAVKETHVQEIEGIQNAVQPSNWAGGAFESMVANFIEAISFGVIKSSDNLIPES